MEFNFPKKEGTGIGKLIPNVSAECREIITKMLIYNADHRMSAGQALKHPYFKELREADKQMAFNDQLPLAHLSGMMRLTHRGADSFS
jgi:serine/threonine protein kinase